MVPSHKLALYFAKLLFDSSKCWFSILINNISCHCREADLIQAVIKWDDGIEYLMDVSLCYDTTVKLFRPQQNGSLLQEMHRWLNETENGGKWECERNRGVCFMCIYLFMEELVHKSHAKDVAWQQCIFTWMRTLADNVQTYGRWYLNLGL